MADWRDGSSSPYLTTASLAVSRAPYTSESEETANQDPTPLSEATEAARERCNPPCNVPALRPDRAALHRQTPQPRRLHWRAARPDRDGSLQCEAGAGVSRVRLRIGAHIIDDEIETKHMLQR